MIEFLFLSAIPLKVLEKASLWCFEKLHHSWHFWHFCGFSADFSNPSQNTQAHRRTWEI